MAMSLTRDPATSRGSGLPKPAKTQRERAAATVEKARRAVVLLEEAFRLMTEDDAIQPAMKYIYAALCEAETRAAVLEDWYERNYSDPGETGARV